MRRRVGPLLVMLAVLASACATASVEVADVSDGGSAVAVDASESDAAATEAAVTTAAPEASVEPVEVALPTGREAIAAAEAAGEPYVLWFWGAH